MGANDFMVRSKGTTPDKAFVAAREQALYDYGHRGYTGTIAEKSSFTMIQLPEGYDPVKYAYELIDKCDSRIDDKWGPAGCIKINQEEYLFFGWASS